VRKEGVHLGLDGVLVSYLSRKEARPLLAKLVVRGLSPEMEPWKKLLQHKICIGRPLGDAKWQASDCWLFYNKGLKRENHSPLVTSYIKAFISVKGNLMQKEPKITENILR